MTRTVTTETALPATIEFEMQPYGTVTLGNLKLVPNARVPNMVDLTGDVVAGMETSFLAGHRSSKPATGSRRIYGFGYRELALVEAGETVTRIAM